MSNVVSFHPTDETFLNPDTKSEVDGTSVGLNTLFNMKVRQSKANLSDPQGHDVAFNITFSMAIPGVFTNTKGNESFSTRNSSIDPIRAGNQYFHIEFNLFSNDINKEPFKTDLVFCGTYAKIYPDRSDSKVVPTWSDGEDTWICWVQRFVFRITLSHIQSLASHNMNIKVWDTKDKCLPKVRFDHPKPPKTGNRSRSINNVSSWIKETVMMISHEFSNTADFIENSDRILPHQIISLNRIKTDTDTHTQRNKSAKSHTTTKSSATSFDITVKEKEALIICAEPKEDPDTNLGSYVQLEKLLETNTTTNIKSETKMDNTVKKIAEIPSGRFTEVSTIIRPESRKSVLLPADVEKYNKMGKISFDIYTSDLFLSDHTVNRSQTSVNSLEDMFCLISIESNIFSPEQKKNLNPLTITIKKIENLPFQGMDFCELNRLYMPLFCEYQFCDEHFRRTVSRAHNKNVIFDDVNCILTGILNKTALKSQIQNSFLTIKLFDRIENEVKEIGDTVDDGRDGMKTSDLGDVNITSSKPTETRVISNKPRGEAKVDLSDLVKKGLKYLEIMVPIVPASDSNVKPDMEASKRYTQDGGSSYIEAGTTLKVSIKLANRFDFNIEPSEDRIYNKIVIINNNTKCHFIKKEIGIEILKHNCKKLSFHGESLSEMQTFLFSVSKQYTTNEALYSGVYIVDNKSEILIVESNHECITALYDLCSSRLDQYQCKFSKELKLLYNQSLSSIEGSNFKVLTMLPLVLSKDISFYVSQPLLYVRNMLPRECVEGICKINELVVTDSMHIALRNKLIPTNQMIESISQYLCSHITGKFDEESSEIIQKNEQKISKNVPRKEIKTAPIGERKKIILPPKRSETRLSVEYVYPKTDCEFSYSCQTLNSYESAKQLIREKLDPNRRYTYSQDYLFSGTFDPVDLNDAYTADENSKKAEPKWIHKAKQTANKDATNIDTLPQSRKDDLQTKWVENMLHKSFMEPTLPERDQTSFKFDLYIRPMKILNQDGNSIMPSYFEQKQTNRRQKEVNEEMWRRKVCVSDTRFRSHRVLPETEMTDRGRLSSNQIAKLKGLRKDDSKTKQRVDVNSIPSTYVMTLREENNPAYTLGTENNRNLLVNYIPVIERDKDFNAVYKSSKDSFIYKKQVKNINTGYESPFSIYC